MNEIEIIAEIGVNHNGDPQQALKLVNAAREAGCDTVKFQLFRGDRYPHLQLTAMQLKLLKRRAEEIGLRFLCTPDTWEDALSLKDIGCDRLKIGSSNLTNINLLRMLPQLGLPVILSTGASEMSEISAAVYALKPLPLTILHCLSAYPAVPEQLNLLVIRELIHSFRLPVGFSDHTISQNAALVALGLGARVFEKHLTLDRFQEGPDHLTSIVPSEFGIYVRALRAAAKMLGSGAKEIMPAEKENRIEYDRFVRQQQPAPLNVHPDTSDRAMEILRAEGLNPRRKC